MYQTVSDSLLPTIYTTSTNTFKRSRSTSASASASASTPEQLRGNGRGPIKKRKVVIEQRPRVRFHEQVEAFKPRVFKTPLLPSSTWLKDKDLSRIRDGIFATLDAMKRKRDSAGSRWKETTLVGGKHCSRGLEDYCVDWKGSLKASAIHRRQNAIRAVLHEQERQFQRHRQKQKLQQKRTQVPLHQPILDHLKLSRVYQDQTGSNIHDGIRKGRIDSEQALAIYSERPLEPPRPGHRRRHSLPASLMLPASTTKPNATKPDTPWGFAPTGSMPRPDRVRRIISVS